MSDPPNEDFNPYQSPEAPSRRGEAETLFDLHGVKSIRVAGALSLEDAGKEVFAPPTHRIVFYIGFLMMGLLLVGDLALMGFLCVYFYGRALRVGGYKFGGYVFGIVCSCFLGLLALCGFIALVLHAATVTRMWRHRRGIFAYREITILPEGTERRSGDATLKTAWNDYRGYGKAKDLVVLYLRRNAVKRRRSQESRHTFTRLERFLRFDRADFFPRKHFPGDAEWEFFLLLVKRTLRRA